jgi:hypothetical protein
MSETVTTETDAGEPAKVETPPDDTDVLFRDDVDEPDEMPTRASRRVVTAWTMVFAALVLAGAGFVAGIQMEKHNEPAATGLPAGLAAFANARNGALNGGAGAFSGAFGNRGANGANAATNGAASATQAPASNSTTGQIKLVDGANIYITTSDGSTVKITTTPASKVTKSVAGAVGDLKAGETITVQGTTGSDGTVAASSISQAP